MLLDIMRQRSSLEVSVSPCFSKQMDWYIQGVALHRQWNASAATQDSRDT